jgi:RimJ/RimL family protein N-acetyltransferase
MTPTLTTERLILRPLALADAPRFARLAADPDVARMTGTFPLQQSAITAEGWILIRQAREAQGWPNAVFAIDLPSEGLIGCIGADPGHGKVEIGYWLGRPYWGHGYASEALKAVTAYAAGLGFGPVVASHFVDNPASGRVLEKAGFAPTGEIAPHFSLARAAKTPCRHLRWQGAAA